MKIRKKTNCCSQNSPLIDSTSLLNNYQAKKKTIVEWKRLIVDGKTCPRCSATEFELEKAKKELIKYGYEIIVYKKEITLEKFQKNTIESNEIIINGKKLEEWLNASVSQTPCCDVCGDKDCRTLEVDDSIFEIIPAEYIIKAVLLANGELTK